MALTLRGGLSVSLLDRSLQGITEMTLVGKDDPQVMLGAEYLLIRMLALRAGYMLEMKGRELGGTAGITGGVGFRLGSLSLDYAFTPLGELGNAHVLGLTYRGSDGGSAKAEGPQPVKAVSPTVVAPAPAPAKTPAPAKPVAAKKPAVAPAKSPAPAKSSAPVPAPRLPKSPSPSPAPAVSPAPSPSR